jgi:transposase
VERPAPRRISRHSLELKRRAVKLSELRGVQVQAIAKALDVHPFMLSRWRKEARDGLLRGIGVGGRGKQAPVREVKRLQELERAHALLQEEHEPSKKTHSVLFRTKAEIFAFIDAERERFTVSRLCALNGVTRAGYYAWLGRNESKHKSQGRMLLEEIRALFEQSRGTYGSLRIHRALAAGCHRRACELSGPTLSHDSRASSLLRSASKPTLGGGSDQTRPNLGRRCHVPSSRESLVVISRSRRTSAPVKSSPGVCDAFEMPT